MFYELEVGTDISNYWEIFLDFIMKIVSFIKTLTGEDIFDSDDGSTY